MMELEIRFAAMAKPVKMSSRTGDASNPKLRGGPGVIRPVVELLSQLETVGIVVIILFGMMLGSVWLGVDQYLMIPAGCLAIVGYLGYRAFEIFESAKRQSHDVGHQPSTHGTSIPSTT